MKFLEKFKVAVRILLVAPLWCDLGFVPNSRGNKAAANLCPANTKGLNCWITIWLENEIGSPIQWD